MNERIQELAKEAMLEHCVSHVRLEKFAELIVRECINICEQGTPTQTTSSGAASFIKQHFGVE